MVQQRVFTMQGRLLQSEEERNVILSRAGNCKSDNFPCEVQPKGLASLVGSKAYTGHDVVLNGLYMLLDVEISKPFRCALLMKYGKYIDVVSSASSMHRPDLLEANLLDVTNCKTDVENISNSTRYGISFSINFRLAKRILSDLEGKYSYWSHLGEEVEEFKEVIKQVLRQGCPFAEAVISKPELPTDSTKDLIAFYPAYGEPIGATEFYLNEGDPHHHAGDFLISTNLIILEQFLRYTDGILLSPFSVDEAIRELIAHKYSAWGTTRILLEGYITLEQLQTIKAQRATHKRREWRVVICPVINAFCNYFYPTESE